MEIKNISPAETQAIMSDGRLEKTGQIGEEKMKSKNASEKAEVQKVDNMSASTYSSVSKDGDTLELSTDKNANHDSAVKTIIKEDVVSTDLVKMSDAALAKCSSSKLKQLLQQGKISKQQYDKAIKKDSK